VAFRQYGASRKRCNVLLTTWQDGQKVLVPMVSGLLTGCPFKPEAITMRDEGKTSLLAKGGALRIGSTELH
jgi:hypothetical protein